ncbi:MAG: hypothetical protein PHX51_06040 [Clostridia bacterium]|nr:hypothetical protein [Clostridia bacterium]
MKAILIYDRERRKGNDKFVYYLNRYLCDRVEVEICYVEDILTENDGAIGANLSAFTEPCFAVMRTDCHALSRLLEKHGVRVFNNSEVTEIFNDKMKTYRLCERLGIDFLDCFELRDSVCADRAESFGFPLVVKSKNGHGGKEVYLAHNANEFKSEVEQYFAQLSDEESRTSRDNEMLKKNESAAVSIANNCKGEKMPYCDEQAGLLAQKVCSSLGRDLRIYLIGGKAVVAMLRIGNGDFRANYKLGGSAMRVSIDRTLTETAEMIASAVKADYIGVDFIFDGLNIKVGEGVSAISYDRAYLNEVEDIVGCRMVYENTDIDMLKLYCEYVLEQMGL